MQASRGSGYGGNSYENKLNQDYAPPMAKGGPVLADHPFVVGENGPELFIPHRDGMIVPHARLQAIRDLGRAA